MDLVNVKEIKNRIAACKGEIARLEQLLALAGGGAGAKTRATPRATAKAGGGRKRGKRGSVTTSILEALGSSGKPITAGDVRNQLVEKGVVQKGSTTVYAMLMQLAKKGAIKKAKSAQGMVYSPAAGRK